MQTLDEIFDGNPPKWLVDFDQDPEQAIRAALIDGYYFGSLNAEDPENLLLGWLSSDIPQFTADRLDPILAGIIEAELVGLKDYVKLRIIRLAVYATEQPLPRSRAAVLERKAELLETSQHPLIPRLLSDARL